MTNTTSATWLGPGLLDGSMSAEPATIDLDTEEKVIIVSKNKKQNYNKNQN